MKHISIFILCLSFWLAQSLVFPPLVLAHGEDVEAHLDTPDASITVPLNENILQDRGQKILERKQRLNNMPPLLLILVGILVIAGVTATILADRQHKKKVASRK